MPSERQVRATLPVISSAWRRIARRRLAILASCCSVTGSPPWLETRSVHHLHQFQTLACGPHHVHYWQQRPAALLGVGLPRVGDDLTKRGTDGLPAQPRSSPAVVGDECHHLWPASPPCLDPLSLARPSSPPPMTP